MKKWFCLVKTNLFGTRKLRALPRTVYLVFLHEIHVDSELFGNVFEMGSKSIVFEWGPFAGIQIPNTNIKSLWEIVELVRSSVRPSEIFRSFIEG